MWHNTGFHHLTHYCSAWSNQPPENLRGPWAQPSVQENSLLQPGTVVPIIFPIIFHIRTRSGNKKRWLSKLHLPQQHIPRPTRATLFPSINKPLQLLVCPWPQNVWNQPLVKNYNYRWYADWNHRGPCFLFGKIVLISGSASGVDGGMASKRQQVFECVR